MSKLADEVFSLLCEAYSGYRIFKEHFVQYSGIKLFFDFYIPELKLFVEVQGDQHHYFNKFFHGNVEGFLNHKRRDSLKKQWIMDNNFSLVEFNTHDFPLSVDKVRQMVYESIINNLK